MQITKGRNIEVVAHRGANGLAPENTRAAIEKCIDFHVDVIELDVCRSLDGVLYNFHDLTLDRTTDGSGPLILRRSAYIDGLDAGAWFSPEFRGERVPRIRDLIEAFRGKLKFFLDVKSGSLRKLVRIIRETGVSEDVFVWFASSSKEQRFMRLAPDIAVKRNIGSKEKLKEAVLPPSTRIIEVPVSALSEEFIEMAHERGLRVMPRCGQGAGPHEWERLVSTGADMVNLDSPQEFAEFIHSAGVPGDK